MITFTRNSLVNMMGDSITAMALSFQALNGLKYLVDSHYIAPTASNYSRPVWVNNAISGYKSADIAATIATALAQNPYTHCVMHFGINDANTSVAAATVLANCNTIKAACVAANVQTLVVGPFAYGELWPTGQNVDDLGTTGVDAVDATMASVFTGTLFTYVSARSGIYAVQEPVLNTPAPGAHSNVLMHLVAASGPGLHPNPGGSKFYTSLVTPYVAFA